MIRVLTSSVSVAVTGVSDHSDQSSQAYEIVLVLYLYKKVTVHLKFNGKPEIILADPVELNHYLSSGTIKGIVTFTLAIRVLKTGGYLVIDELEKSIRLALKKEG